MVIADAFESFLEETDLNTEIDSLLHTINREEVHTIEHASAKIKGLIRNAEIPAQIAEEIRSAFNKLGAEYVAVRSSATAEDSTSAAWAGQLESYLNVSESNLIESVQKCWASLFTPRALFYRFERGLHGEHISIAVIVQKMVDADAAGIVFSVHPVTEDRNQLIVEAALGLGEAIVSGQITPDSYVVEKEPRRIIDKNIVVQTKMLARGKTGMNEWIEVDRQKGEERALSDTQIFELSELILKVERHFGFPVDIEWALLGNTFHIVQSRPITTLGEQGYVKNDISRFTKPFQEYIQLFQGRGVPFLMANIILHAYPPLNILAIYDNNLYTSFLPKISYEQTKKDGAQLFADKEKYRRFLKKIADARKESDAFFTTLLGKKNVTKKEIGRALQYAREYTGLYFHLDFLFTDGAYEQMEKSDTIRRNFDVFGDLKLEYREYLNKIFLGTNAYIPKFLGILSKQFSVPVDSLWLYTPEELVALSEQKPLAVEKLADRKHAYAIVQTPEDTASCVGDDAHRFSERFYAEQETGADVIKGQTANKGVVKARACVFRIDLTGNFDKLHEFVEEMEKGEVLVAETTAPEIILACQKASAIVTNQGGMMSHAAIVSRELNVPCIVGTSNAVESINTGDLLEVDADRGVVKILERKS